MLALGCGFKKKTKKLQTLKKRQKFENNKQRSSSRTFWCMTLPPVFFFSKKWLLFFEKENGKSFLRKKDALILRWLIFYGWGRILRDKVSGTSQHGTFGGHFLQPWSLVGTLAETPLFSDLIQITDAKNSGSQNSSETRINFPKQKMRFNF